MIFGYTTEFVFFQQVGAAVTHMGKMYFRVCYHQGRAGGTHTLLFFIRRGGLKYAGIGSGKSLPQVFLNASVLFRIEIFTDDDFSSHPAGNFTGLVTTHSIGDHQQASFFTNYLLIRDPVKQPGILIIETNISKIAAHHYLQVGGIPGGRTIFGYWFRFVFTK